MGVARRHSEKITLSSMIEFVRMRFAYTIMRTQNHNGVCVQHVISLTVEVIQTRLGINPHTPEVMIVALSTGLKCE